MIQGAVLLALLLAAEPQPSMLRVVVRNVSEDLSPSNFARKPKTMFRLGTCCLRVEEELDSVARLHILVIINEPNMWMINQVDREAKHVVDPGPTFIVHALILEEQGLEGLEFGQEMAYMKTHGASREGPFSCATGRCQRYVAQSGGYRVSLVTSLPGDKPTEIRITRPKGGPVTIVYDAYENGLPAKPELFRPPVGITIRESK
jgi:hypothetical protein